MRRGLCVWVWVVIASGCMLEADYSPPQFADEGFIEPDASPGQPAPKLPAEPARVSFEDWACPEGWSPAPAMVDGDGQVLEVEGVEPFDVCLPPQLPEGSAAQLQMKDWDCPQGWNAVPGMADAEGNPLPRDGIEPFTVCEPPDLPEDCPEGFIAQIGSAQCVRQGVDCPPEGQLWHDEAEIRDRASGFEGRVWYVQPGAEAGDGRREAPLASPAEAIAQADAGDIVAMSVGVHEGDFAVEKALAIMGACVAQTRLLSQTPHEIEPTVGFGAVSRGLLSDTTIAGPRAGVRIIAPEGPTRLQAVSVVQARGVGVSIEGGSGGVVLEALSVRQTQVDEAQARGLGLEVLGGSVTLMRSVIEQNHSQGILVSGAETSLTLEEVIVQDTQPRPGDQLAGYGIEVLAGAEVDARRLVVARNHTQGIHLVGDTTSASLVDMSLVDTRSQASDAEQGEGMVAEQGAQVSLLRSVVARNRRSGLWIRDGGSHIEVVDSLIKDTLSNEARSKYGEGLYLSQSATGSAVRLVVLRSVTTGIRLYEEAHLVMEDVISHDTAQARDTHSSGQGLGMRVASSAEGRRVSLMHNHHYGIITTSESTLVLEDAAVHDTRTITGGTGGYGILMNSGSQVTLRRVAVTQNTHGGLWVNNAEAALVAEDVFVQGTLPSRGGLGSDGAALLTAGEVEGTRIFLSDNLTRGMTVHKNARVDLEEVAIFGSRSEDDGLTKGRGIVVKDNGHLTMCQGVLLQNETHGILAEGDGTFELEDILIAQTRPRASTGLAGLGLEVRERASGSATRMRLHQNLTVGALVSGASVSVTFEDLTVSETQPRQPDRILGRGLESQDGATVVLRRATFKDNHDRGVLLGDLTLSTLEDVLIVHTRHQESDGLQGRGLEMLPRSRATMKRIALVNNIEVGLSLFGAEVTVEDLFVASTREQGCAPNCVPLFGTGIVMVGGSLTLADFEIMGSALAGLHLVNPSSFFAQRGVVRSNEIGLNFQGGPDPDLSELFEGVEFLENGQNYGSEDLIVPAEPVPSSRGQQ